MELLKSLNKYDKIIIILLLLLAFGNIGGALQPVRIIALLCAPLVLCDTSFIRDNAKIVLACLFWIIYASLSYLWTNDITLYSKNLMYLITHIFLFLELIMFSRKANNSQQSIILGWLLFFVATLPIALNEIINDSHLNMSIFDSDLRYNVGGQIFQKKFATVTFGNYNTYSLFLCLVLPFLLTGILKSYNKKQIMIKFVLLLMIIYIIMINSSRGAILCLTINISLFMIYILRSQNRYRVFIKNILIIGLILMLFFAGEMLIEQLNSRMYGKSSIMEDTGRTELISLGLNVFLNTYGIGVGVGGIENAYRTLGSDIKAVHNMPLEILIEFGLIIFVLVLSFWILLFKRLKQSISADKKCVLLVSLCSFPFYSVINSGYVTYAPIWVFFATLWIYVKNNKC